MLGVPPRQRINDLYIPSLQRIIISLYSIYTDASSLHISQFNEDTRLERGSKLSFNPYDGHYT